MMYLTHRNRVIETRSTRFNLRCGPPSPAERAYYRHLFVGSHTRRMHKKSPLRGRGGTAAEEDFAEQPRNDRRGCGG